MDVLKRSHRFSYAAAFGTLARLCAGIVFDAQYAFDYNGPTYLKGLFVFVFCFNFKTILSLFNIISFLSLEITYFQNCAQCVERNTNFI